MERRLLKGEKEIFKKNHGLISIIFDRIITIF